MKLKKLWRVMVAAMTAIICVFGAVACGGGNNSNKITIFIALPDDGLDKSVYMERLQEK